MKDRKTSLAGEHIKDFFPDIDFDSVIRDKQKILSEVCGSEENRCWSIVPVAGDSEEFGCVLTFQGTEQIQAEEGKLRKRCIRTALRPGTFSTYFTGTAAWRRLSARP